MPKYRVKFEGELFMLKKLSTIKEAEEEGWFLEMNDFGDWHLRKIGERKALGTYDGVKAALRGAKGFKLIDDFIAC